MAEVFGLDFGTTNSVGALIADGRTLDFVDDLHRPHPSVVLFRGDEVIVGREARQQLAQIDAAVVEDAVTSPKRFVINERPALVSGVRREPRELAAHVLRHVREQAMAAYPEFRLDDAVVTIPVQLRGEGRRILRQAANDVGIRVRQFVHEPLAALYGWFRMQSDGSVGRDGKLFLVFDWGGGTLDLTLCRLDGEVLSQVHNRGEDRVGGDLFDERLRRLVLGKHAQQHQLGHAIDPQPGAAAKLLARCEEAKIDLSRKEDALVFLADYAAAEGEARDIEVTVTREELEKLNADLLDLGMEAVELLMQRAQVSDPEIEAVIALGGMTQMPAIRNRLLHRFGAERVPKVEHAALLIARGAAWIAHDGRRLRLSKPFELLVADDSAVSLIGTDIDLPAREEHLPFKFGLHCVDPRDGFARFRLMRPVPPGQPQATDPRLDYATLLLPVDPAAHPLTERLNLEVMVDEDLVVKVRAKSDQTSKTDEAEIHDLEFGLGID